MRNGTEKSFSSCWSLPFSGHIKIMKFVKILHCVRSTSTKMGTVQWKRFQLSNWIKCMVKQRRKKWDLSSFDVEQLTYCVKFHYEIYFRQKKFSICMHWVDWAYIWNGSPYLPGHSQNCDSCRTQMKNGMRTCGQMKAKPMRVVHIKEEQIVWSASFINGKMIVIDHAPKRSNQPISWRENRKKKHGRSHHNSVVTARQFNN